MYERKRDRIYEQKKRMYRYNRVRSLGKKGVIFRRMYGCDPYTYMDKQTAKGKTGREVEADMCCKLGRIEKELRERDIEAAKIAYAEKNNNGFIDATGYNVPFDTS